MIIGPIVITASWTKTIERALASAREAQAEAQRLSMVRSRLIVRLRADNKAMRETLVRIVDGVASGKAKAPDGVGASV